MPEPRKVLIYNLFPLLAGAFPAWKSHIQRASEMGFNWIFVNPIHRPGSSGSLYSVKDYFALNPLFVDPQAPQTGEEQLQAVAGYAREIGVEMMVDLVVNHCAVDSDLISKHPAWFEWERQGVVVNPFCQENGRKVVWKDLAKFDHRHTRDPDGLYKYFFKVVRHLIDLGFSGFRCDAAYQVPTAFWSRLIRESKSKHPEILFAAETLGCTADQTRQTAAAGFDFIFNSSKWWDFKGHWLLEQYNLTREIAPSIGFPESHDTKRLAEEVHGNVSGLKQRDLFAAFFSTGLMIPTGYEFGFRKKPNVVSTRPQDWEETGIDITEYLTRVNRMKSTHIILQEEAPMEILQNGNPQVLIMWKGSLRSQAEALLILNKDIWHPQHFSVPRLQEFVQAGAPLKDISPENQMDYIPAPFSYELRPGEGLVFVTTRDLPPQD